MPDTLDDTSKQLSRLHREFSTASSQGDEAKEAVGARQIQDAIGEFTGNWRRHRDGMLSKLETAAEMVANCHEAYTETDEALACALEE